MRGFKVVLGVTAVSAGFGSISAPASATVDSTPPSLTLGDVHYRTGASIYTEYTDSNDNSCTPSPTCTNGYYTFPLYMPWKTSDPSGICSEAVAISSYEAYTGNGDAPFNNVVGGATPDGFDSMFQPDPDGSNDSELSAVNNTTRRWNYNFDTWDDGRGPSERQVRSIDCANNIAVTPIFSTMWMDGTTVAQDDGSTAPVIYAGSWRTSHCLCFSGGTTHVATTAGASASFSMSGRRVALVMEKAADRGSADIYVDGVKKATISTYSATTMHKSIVWESLVSTNAFHTIKVVNKATAGHPRIDVDAFLHS